jgi:hypothetical protein
MDTTFREWEITRVVTEGGKNACINARCQTTTDDDVTIVEDQDGHRNEEIISQGEGSTSTEDEAIRSFGAPARKVGAVGRRDRHKKMNIEKIGLEGGEILQCLFIAQLVENMYERSSQAQAQCQRITKMYHKVEKEVTDVGVRK